MKKKNIIITILVLILITFCICIGWLMSSNKKNLNRENKSFMVTCDSDVIKINKEVVCTLIGNVNDYEVSAVSATINNSNDFKITEVIPHSSWEGDGEFGDVDLYTDVNKKNKFDILKFKILLINNDAKTIDINIVDNSLFDEEFTEHKLNDVCKTLKVEK